jgi:cellulose synthase/poly-beta-1,6-N-acetylglucosamine synthase-like glycosyltransferase
LPDLVAALDRLDWPRDKLDVKLLLEADDPATIAAARFAASGPPYEIVVVPSVGPRTKPKALAFALPLARGELVTVYDAEDRPHPRQLREAHAVFVASEPDLACLQSPLLIDNGHHGWLPLAFSVEYAGLFDGLLPTLAAFRMPLPLGGTSNHFRRDALEYVGGWDPYNVTEDADLGVRFARFGYRTSTLDLPTREEAPVTFGVWFRQRTRWSKGWLQTWLVHTRNPARLARDLGPRGLLGFGLVSTGLLVSALIYPIYLAALIAGLSDPLRLWSEDDAFGSAVIGLNLFNLFAGYTAMALLSLRALALRGRMAEASGVCLLPLFWLLVSLACYRALFELVIRPHHWAKTPHRRRRREAEAATPDVPPATPSSRRSRPLAPQ